MTPTRLPANLAEVYDDLMRATARDVRRATRRRRRALVGAAVIAILAISAATAIARGWILDSGPTLAEVSQVAPLSTPTSVEFALDVDAGLIAHPVERAEPLAIPPGSVFSGTLIRRADGDNGQTCVRAIDGGGCGTLTPDSTVGGLISHPTSNLPPLAFGAIGANIASVTVTCLNGTFPATLIAGRAYAATLPLHTDTDHCGLHWTTH